MQPIVENAIWHGISHSEKKCLLLIDFKLKDNKLTVTIEDNGIGRAKAAEINKKTRQNHISHSTDILETRLNLLNIRQKKNVTVHTEDLYEVGNAAGTRVFINILTDIF